MMNNIQILGISGSLRAVSSNTNIIIAAKILAPPKIEITLYSELANLPYFNPDLDREPLPNTVTFLRKQIKASDGIIISSPEYAHGVPGSLKNALDWLVSSVEFHQKPVALINTNPRATIALASLREILTTMSAKIIEPASITLDIAGKSLSQEELIDDRLLADSLKQAIAIFGRAISPN